MTQDYIYNPERNPLIRSDYRPSEYRIPKASLYLNLDETNTNVKNTMTVEPNPDAKTPGGPLILNGEDIKLKSIKINGKALDRADYTVDADYLIIKRPPAGTFQLEIENDINPTANTKLSGIYTSGAGIISSQNEAQGFRRITYFLDRPDNLTVFDATVEADKAKYPILLANGNGDYKATTDLGNGRHAINWVDPWPKPSYLFATVAGDLKVLEDEFITMSGKKVDLRIFVQAGYENQVDWAMESIKRAMRWDEVRYGREYDLENYHVVAVDKFNAGAMENKGLNIFNVSRLVGNPETSTDNELMDIEEVIGHEYFHNWTGDRVTVRDWFEISLKESLTSLRQRQFASDTHSAAVKLIDDATVLRSGQFIEDSGPSAHFVRPERVEEFDNIYSTTVYQKGKHVLAMMNTILGDKMWRTAMDNYFDKFDGKAVTVDDFIDNMQDTSGINLKQFRRWYSQSGTPEVGYEGKYDAVAKTYTLTLTQDTPATADQPKSEKQNLHIPISVGLIGQSGKDVPLQLKGEAAPSADTTRVLNLTEAKQTFVFENVSGPVVPSILRNFSAPVKITTQPSDEELIFRMANDSNPFNKFDAKERLMMKTLLGLISDAQEGKKLKVDQSFLDAYGANVAKAANGGGDEAFAAQLLALPAYNIIIQNLKTVDPDAIRTATKFLSKTVVETFKDDFVQIYKNTLAPAGEKYDVVPTQVGRRSLHNLALSRLGALEEPGIVALAQSQFSSATNMTEKLGALSTLARLESAPEAGKKALADFYEKFKNDGNILDKWLSLQAATAKNADDVRASLKHKAFDMTNPNKVRALLGGLSGNPTLFHKTDGSGYKLLADVVVELNSINPRVGAQIVRPLTQFKRYDAERQKLMVEQLGRVMETPNLEKGVKEVVGQALALVEKPATAAVTSFDKAAKKADAPANDTKPAKKGPVNGK